MQVTQYGFFLVLESFDRGRHIVFNVLHDIHLDLRGAHELCNIA